MNNEQTTETAFETGVNVEVARNPKSSLSK